MTTADLFHVETVEVTTPPAPTDSPETADAAGGSWCRYVIANRNSRVVGRYRGSVAQTRHNAEQLATSFNERARNNRSAWSPRSKTIRKAPRGARTAAR